MTDGRKTKPKRAKVKERERDRQSTREGGRMSRQIDGRIEEDTGHPEADNRELTENGQERTH